jgi:hypothetical protein
LRYRKAHSADGAVREFAQTFDDRRLIKIREPVVSIRRNDGSRTRIGPGENIIDNSASVAAESLTIFDDAISPDGIAAMNTDARIERGCRAARGCHERRKRGTKFFSER